MNRRSTPVVMGGILIALLGMFLVFAYSRATRSGSGSGASVQAFVATADIPAGSRWEDMAGRIEKRSVPEGLRPATAVTTGGQLNGRTSVRAIARGEILTAAQFNTSASGGLDIPAGHNAVTMNLAVPQGVARYVQPGSFVNIYASFKGVPGPANPADTTLTRLILAKVKVLANQPATLSLERSNGVAGSGGDILLTVAVTPDQAEKLIFAKENGSLWFGLVNAADGPASTGGKTFRTALS